MSLSKLPSNEIYQSLATDFDIEKLVKHLKSVVFPLDPQMQAPAFGGWSVLSSNQNYRDGWHRGHVLINKDTRIEDLTKNLKQLGAKPWSEYVYPTEICSGYLLEVIDSIKAKGFSPRRARIIKLCARSASAWHRDAPDDFPLVRLHVPIITNPECFFEIETGRCHLAADGNSYLIRVNRIHRVVNGGETDRYHLVMDVVSNETSGP